MNNKVTVHRYEESEVDVVNATLRKPSVFLAGPTVRGHQQHLTSWRFAAIEEFEKQGFDGELIVPEFTSTVESDKGKEWIPKWEFNGLKYSACIMFWIPRTRELIGLTTNMEFGYWQGREPDKMVYGRPDDAYRMGYLDVMWKRIAEDAGMIANLPGYEPEIYRSLEDTVSAAVKKAEFLWNKDRPMTNG